MIYCANDCRLLKLKEVVRLRLESCIDKSASDTQMTRNSHSGSIFLRYVPTIQKRYNKIRKSVFEM